MKDIPISITTKQNETWSPIITNRQIVSWYFGGWREGGYFSSKDIIKELYSIWKTSESDDFWFFISSIQRIADNIPEKHILLEEMIKIDNSRILEKIVSLVERREKIDKQIKKLKDEYI